MADNRELTFGMDFGLDDAINRLGETIDPWSRLWTAPRM